MRHRVPFHAVLCAAALFGCAHEQNPQPKNQETIMSSKNTELARRYFDDIWNRGDATAVDRLVAPDVVGHVNAITLHGNEILKNRLAAVRGAYQNPHFTVEAVVAEGDRAVARWSFRGVNVGSIYGQPPTGKPVSITGMNMFRLKDEKIAEIWVSADDLGELEQLGIVKAPQGAGQ